MAPTRVLQKVYDYSRTSWSKAFSNIIVTSTRTRTVMDGRRHDDATAGVSGAANDASVETVDEESMTPSQEFFDRMDSSDMCDFFAVVDCLCGVDDFDMEMIVEEEEPASSSDVNEKEKTMESASTQPPPCKEGDSDSSATGDANEVGRATEAIDVGAGHSVAVPSAPATTSSAAATQFEVKEDRFTTARGADLPARSHFIEYYRKLYEDLSEDLEELSAIRDQESERNRSRRVTQLAAPAAFASSNLRRVNSPCL